MVDVQLRRRVQELEDIVRGLLNMRGANNSPVQVAWQGNTPLLQFSKEDWFPVMVTSYTPEPGTGSVSSVSGFYSGYELEVNFNADYGTAVPGLTFSPAYQPLVELNNQVITTFPFRAYARYRSTTVEYGPVYEFDVMAAVAQGQSISVVTNVCPIYGDDNSLQIGDLTTLASMLDALGGDTGGYGA